LDVKAYLVESPIGIFALDAKGKIAEKALFGKDKETAAAKLDKLRSAEVIEELAEVLGRLSKERFNVLAVESEELARKIEEKSGLKVAVEPGAKVAQKFRAKLPSIAVDLRIFKTEEDYNSFAREVTIQLAKAAVSVAVGRRDLYAVQTVRAIDDLDKALNVFAGRIREWYGLHFPELDKLIEKHETYVRLVTDLGKRENFTKSRLVKEGIPEDRAAVIEETAKRSMGADIADEDLEWLRSFCADWLELLKFRGKAEGYIEKVMSQVSPNMSSLVGPMLSARLISIAGGLENLAKMPASTVQVLGAEKALFRSLKTGARPPKHGVIFQYGAIHQSPRWQRGKIARALSGKLSIAARLDYFGGEFKGEVLRGQLEKKIKEISEKYGAPPARGRHAERTR
jgi:nucleolar protein 56